MSCDLERNGQKFCFPLLIMRVHMSKHLWQLVYNTLKVDIFCFAIQKNVTSYMDLGLWDGSLAPTVFIIIGAFGVYRVIGHVCYSHRFPVTILFLSCLFVCLFVCLSVCPHVFSKSIEGTELALST